MHIKEEKAGGIIKYLILFGIVERKCIDALRTCSSKTLSICLSIIVEMDGIESVAT